MLAANSKGLTMDSQPKWMTWTGWAITVLIALTLTFSASMKFMAPPEFKEQFVDKFGFPAELGAPIGVIELACMLVFLIPQTSVLGAVLLTAYLGGATVTHVRVNDSFVPPIVVGVLVWLALFFRDGRIRALLPWRTSPQPPLVSKT